MDTRNERTKPEIREPEQGMKIPPVIHYVWVGGKPKPKLIQSCMASWQKHLKGYQFIEWNEENFDIESVPFVREAYRQKKWAFVSDYIRAWALYNYGGIYLDTDNVVCRNLDRFRKDRAFAGFERTDYAFTACFGTEKGHPLVLDIMNYYDGREFTFDEDNPLPFNNTISVSNLLCETYGAQLNNQEQLLKEGIRLYPDTVLCNPSSESCVLHVFTGTWMKHKRSRLQEMITGLKARLHHPWQVALYALFFRRNK